MRPRAARAPARIGRQRPRPEFEVDSFLYELVRNLARELVKAGEGRRDADSIRVALAARDRRPRREPRPPRDLGVLARYGVEPRDAHYGADVRFSVDVPVGEAEDFTRAVTDATAGRARMR